MQEYFVYFKFFEPKSWSKRSAECRWLFVQSFPRLKIVSGGVYAANGPQVQARQPVIRLKNERIVAVLSKFVIDIFCCSGETTTEVIECDTHFYNVLLNIAK